MGSIAGSEVIARVIGGAWVDIASTDLFEWAMFVPPSSRVWPFARVARFATQGLARARSSSASIWISRHARWESVAVAEEPMPSPPSPCVATDYALGRSASIS